jgi:single-strand DNA-binding protein
MNNINLIGRLTKEPEAIQQDGKTLCRLTIAVDDTHAVDRADFIRVAVHGPQGDNCEKYLHKGFLVGVSGRIRSERLTTDQQEAGITYDVYVVADHVQFLQWPERE